ncbi:CWF19-like protein 1 [Trichoplax sp. H2]|nr:CWF19-like protein 1 [Trichoplax sp. H2]|eukprot:RDD38916.1 CWF19-like protein 1 [Trichoplax sp. H2]
MLPLKSIKYNLPIFLYKITYKDSLRKFFKSLGKECVIFERNFRSQHLQLQVVPIPSGTTNIAKELFQELGETNSLTFQLLPSNIDLTKILSEGSPFFLVEFDDGEMLLHRIRGKFPLQFGRQILASESLLNMPDRVNWKDCEISVEEATQSAQSFRKMFKSFDFNLN